MKNYKLFYTCFYFIAFAMIFNSCTQTEGKNSAISKNTQVPKLLIRNIITGSDEELNKILTLYDNCKIALEKNSTDFKSMLDLATVFITEGRITGNLSYYNNAALQMLDQIIDAHPSNKDFEFQALNYKSAVLLSLHQFQDAKTTALEAKKLNARNAGVYGALVDAEVELGNYDMAIKYCDTMLAIRPDLRSYSRASYIRQIHGDNQGAIEAMQLAVNAGVPGSENTEWARVTLADLYLNIGNIEKAESLYKESLLRRPNYVYAEIGKAKIEKAKKNYDAAILHCENAINGISESAFISFMGEIYLLKGEQKKAEEIFEDVYKLLLKAEKEQSKEEAVVKHNGNRELASAAMKVGKFDEAIEFAQADLKTRPNNIDANELAAWIYYLKADYSNAKIHADKMLATQVQNANTLKKASLIYSKSGDLEKGNACLEKSKMISVYVDPMIQ